jgi:uncharacterized protein YegL
MATDNTHVPQNDDTATMTAQEFNPEVVQLAENTAPAGGAGNAAAPQGPVIPGAPNGQVTVNVPAGQTVVRVQVAPGETIDLPFDGALAAKFGAQGNLAIKSGDQTIILLGYGAANQQAGVTLHDHKGQPIDVATTVAQTDPNLDIQTAAGPAAGPAGGQGGHLFFGFTPNDGLGGLGELGVINPTELQYKLIQPDEQILLIPQTDTSPQLVTITVTQDGVVNEDDLHHTPQRITESLVINADPDNPIGGGPDGLNGQIEGSGIFTHVVTGFHQLYVDSDYQFQNGNDPFDTTEHEAGSQTDAANLPDGDGVGAFPDDNGGTPPIDQDREPLTTTATITVNFFADVPGKITFDNGGVTPIIDALTALNLTSHGNPLEFALLPATASHGESIVAFYTLPAVYEGEATQVLIFSLEIQEPAGLTSLSDFHMAFTIYGVLDDQIQGQGLPGEDMFNLDALFFMTDSNNSVTPSPAGALIFHDVDDVPELGRVCYSLQSAGEEGPYVDTATHYEAANLTIGLDESKGAQHTHYNADLDTLDPNHTSDPANSFHQHQDQKTDDVWNPWPIANEVKSEIDGILGASPADPLVAYQQGVLGNLDSKYLSGNTFCAPVLGAACTNLVVSFGADGKALNDVQAGQTLFDQDSNTSYATAFQLYMQDGSGAPADNAPVDAHLTNAWISVDDGSGNITNEQVTAYQLDANTIIGIALPPDVKGEDIQTFISDEIKSGSGIPVFALHLDPTSGELTLVQYHQINHDPNLGPNDVLHILTDGDGQLFHFRATDFDGDFVDAPLEVTIVDDAPCITCVTYGEGNHSAGQLDEDFLGTTNSPGNKDTDTDPNSNHNDPSSNGDAPGGTTASGFISATGVDKPLTYKFDIPGLVNDGDQVLATDALGNPLTSAGGDPITLSIMTNFLGYQVITGTYTDDSGSHNAFQMTLNLQGGGFAFTLWEALAHPDSNNDPNDNATDDGTARYEDNLNLNFGAKVTDVDGDVATTTLHFVVNDDAPMLLSQPHITYTDTGHNQVEQIDQVNTFAEVDQAPCLQESTCSVVINPDNQPGWVLSSITVKDENGNTQGDDSLFSQSGTGFGVISGEDGGNGGRFDEINFDNTAGGGVGGSESLIFNFAKLIESGTVELARFYSGEHGVGDEQGHWVAMRGGVEVGQGDFEANSSTGAFGFAIPTIPGGFDQLIFTALEGSNLQPGATDNSDYLVKQLNLNLLPTNVQEGEFDYRFGADNGILPHDALGGSGFTVSTAGINLTSGGQPVTLEQDVENGHIVVYGYKNHDHNEPVFKFDIDPNAASGSGGEHTAHYTFTEFAPLDNDGGMSNIPFDIKIQDRDGDAIHTTVSVCLDDSAPVVYGTDATVFEKGLDQPGILNDGTHKGDGSNIVSGFLNFSYNGDGPGSITNVHFQGFGGVPAIPAGNAGVDGSGNFTFSNALFNLVVDHITGAYTFTLRENIQHDDTADDGFTNVNGTNPTVNIADLLKDLNFDVTVKDGDGTVAIGSNALIIHVTDDGPIANNDAYGSFAEHSGDHNVGLAAALLLNDQAGADGYKFGSLAIGNGGVGDQGGTLTIDGFGFLHYTPPTHVNNPGGNPVTETFTYSFQDSDGDTATANVTFKITDTGPSVGKDQSTATVDEDGLKNGLPGGPSDYTPDVVHNQPNEASWIGKINFSYGFDGPGDIALSTTGGNTGLTKLDGTAIHTVWDASTHTLTGFGGVDTTDVVFSLQITNTATGDYTLHLLQPIKHLGDNTEDNKSLNVNIDVVDSDGTHSTGGFKVTINDDTPTVTAAMNEAVTRLDETPGPQGEDHVGGSDPFLGAYGTPIEWAQSPVAVASAVGGAYGADGPAASNPLVYSANPGSPGIDSGLTDTATNSHIYLYQDGNNVVGKVGGSGGPVAVAFGIDPVTGKVNVAEYLAIHHQNAGDPNDVAHLATNALQATITVTDGDGDKASSSVDISSRISFYDDGPTAHAISETISASASVNTNLQLVLDVSGSMADPAGGLTLVRKLVAAKEAIYQLLDAYQNAGSVMVQLITFSTGANTQFSTWVSAETLKHTLFGLSAGGNTNYDAPLDQAINHAWTGDKSAGQFTSGSFQNTSYFLSDGLPNVNGGVEGTAGITGTEITKWTSFLNAHNIDSFAFGMGSGATQSTLNPIAYDGAAHTDANAKIVTDFSNLPTELTNTVSGTAVVHLKTDAGNTIGTDAANSSVRQITLGAKTFTYDNVLHTVTAGGGALPADYSFNSVTHELTVNTAIGQLIVNMDTGDGHFNATGAQGATVDLGYTLRDGDGDTAASTLHFGIGSSDHAPIAHEDYVVTNISGAFDVKDAWLMHNDSDKDGDTMSVSGVHNGTDLSTVHSHDTVNHLVHVGSGESVLNYDVTANGKTDDLNFVSITHDTNDSVVDGNGLDNILIAADGVNTTLKGYEGNDLFIGGTGNDIFMPGSGNNSMDMSKGGHDTAKFTALTGTDVIDGFTAHGGSGTETDHIDLTSVLSGLGNASQRAAHVFLEANGSDTIAHVATDNTFTAGNAATYDIHITLHSVTPAQLTVGAAATDDIIV